MVSTRLAAAAVQIAHTSPNALLFQTTLRFDSRNGQLQCSIFIPGSALTEQIDTRMIG